MSVSWYPANHVLSATNVDYSGGVRVWVEDARNLYRLSLFAVWATYTGVTVKLQGTLDGTNWADIAGMSITTSGNIVSSEIGPYKQVAVFVTTAAATGTMNIWTQRSTLTR